MMRQGIPMAGNHLMTELVIVTGAIELIVVDYQCIMPSLVTVGNCYHTKMITTSDKATFTGAEHVKFEPHNGMAQARKVVRLAIERFPMRNKNRVEIPQGPVELITGFSNEALLEALGGTLTPLIDAIKAGKIRGAVAIVGCNNPKFKQDYCNVNLAKELIKKDILVLVTGCVTSATGKAGLWYRGLLRWLGPASRRFVVLWAFHRSCTWGVVLITLGFFNLLLSLPMSWELYFRSATSRVIS